MADNNYSGLVNERDASDHGAAVIFPSSKTQAVDYFVKLNEDLAKQHQARELLHQKQMGQQESAMKKTAAGVIYPFQKVMNDVSEQWTQTAGAAMQEKDPVRKLQLNQQRVLLENKAAQIAALSKQSEDQLKKEQQTYQKNPDAFDQDHIDYMNSKYATTMANTVEDAIYKPGVVKTKDTFNKDLKDFTIKRIGNYDITDPLKNGSGVTHTQNGIPLAALTEGATNWVDTHESAQKQIKQAVAASQNTDTPVTYDEARKNMIAHVAGLKAAENSGDINKISTDVNGEQFIPIGAGTKISKPFAPKTGKGTIFINGEYSGKGNSTAVITEDDNYTYLQLGYKNAPPDKAQILVDLKDGSGAKYLNPQPKIRKSDGTVIITGEKYEPKKVGVGLAAKTEWVPTGHNVDVVIDKSNNKKVMKDLESSYGAIFKYNDDGTIGLNADKNPNVSYAKDARVEKKAGAKEIKKKKQNKHGV